MLSNFLLGYCTSPMARPGHQKNGDYPGKYGHLFEFNYNSYIEINPSVNA